MTIDTLIRKAKNSAITRVVAHPDVIYFWSGLELVDRAYPSPELAYLFLDRPWRSLERVEFLELLKLLKQATQN